MSAVDVSGGGPPQASAASPERRGGKRRIAACALLACVVGMPGGGSAQSGSLPPRFRPDTAWLKMPPGWVLGEVSSVRVDHAGHVWILQRPETAAASAPPVPPILEFSGTGRFLRGFGGPGAGYEWPRTEHSLALDRAGNVWIAGSYRAVPSEADDMVLEFDKAGRFVRQIGRRGASRGDDDTANVHAPGDLFVDDQAGELYVADGYGNRRVIVYGTRDGKFRRMWSAFGAPPLLTPAPVARAPGASFEAQVDAGPAGFNGVHGVLISRDRLVYVSDRNNQRIQVFTPAGRFLRQAFVDRNMRSPATVSGLAFSPDRRQRWLYVADWGNSSVLAIDRESLAQVAVVGGSGTAAGRFLGPHLIATDRRGALYVAEVQGRRVQRLAPDP